MTSEDFDKRALQEALQSNISGSKKDSYQEILDQYKKIGISHRQASPHSSNQSHRSCGVLLGNPVLRYRIELEKPINLEIPRNGCRSQSARSVGTNEVLSHSSLTARTFDENTSNGSSDFSNIGKYKSSEVVGRSESRNEITSDPAKYLSNKRYPLLGVRIDHDAEQVVRSFENLETECQMGVSNFQTEIKNYEKYNQSTVAGFSEVSTDASQGSSKKTEYWLWDVFSQKYNLLDCEDAQLLKNSSNISSHTFHLPASPLLTPNGLLKTVNSSIKIGNDSKSYENDVDKCATQNYDNQIIKKKCEIIRRKLAQEKKSIHGTRPKLRLPFEQTPLKERGRVVVKNQSDFEKIAFMLAEEGGEFPFLMTNSGVIKHDPVGRGAKYREIWGRDRFLTRISKLNQPRFCNEL